MRKKLITLISATLFVLGVAGVHFDTSAQSVDFTFYGKCLGSPTDFAGSVAGITPASWAWDYGDGFTDVGQFVSHTYGAANSPGGYPVTLTVTDLVSGLPYSITKYVVIRDIPFVFFTYSTPTCSNDSIQFHNLSNPLPGWKYYKWDFGDGSPVQTILFPGNPDIAHKYASSSSYNVTLEVMTSDSCVNQNTITITVIPGPQANYAFTGSCQNQTVHFTDQSSPGSPGGIAFWGWDFDDPLSGVNDTSNLPNPDHIFQFPGTYHVLLKVTNFNGCWDTISKAVVINPPPPVDFTHNETCLNQLITFTVDPLITNIPSIATYEWDFGDSSPPFFGQNAAHAYTSTGTYVVTLRVTDLAGCINTVSHTVIIHSLPFSNFAVNINNCVGSPVEFLNNSTTAIGAGFIVRSTWNFGDGNTLDVKNPGNQTVYHTYTSSGPFAVTLIVKSSDSCTDISSQTITISDKPLADFEYILPACSGSAVSFHDISQQNGGGPIVQWSWDFDDGASGLNNFSVLPDPSHTFTGPATYQVKLIVANSFGCTDTIVIPVTVSPKPVVDFSWTFNCVNKAVQFAPDPTMTNITSWLWNFGDAVTSTTQSPNHTYATAGNYLVTLSVIDNNGCSNSFSKTITILPQPIASFTYSQPACKMSSVIFTNNSSAPIGIITRSEWNFGDGNSLVVSTNPLVAVSHTFTSSGSFSVTLRVITLDSCEKTITLPVVISPNPESNFSYLTTCVDSPVEFTSNSQAGAGSISGWLWTFGDPGSGSSNTSLLEDPTHTYNSPGTYPVSLIVTNTGGCSDTLVKNVIIHALPGVDFTVSAGCMNDSTYFSSSAFVDSLAVTDRVWDFGDGMTATNISNPYHSYTSSGLFAVTLTVTDTAGCINSKTHMITIVPPPVALFQVSSQNCANLPIFFTNQSSTPGGTITSWLWEFGDGADTLLNAPSTGNISHIYPVGGNFTIKLTIHTSLGCESFFTKSITVSASPLALFSYDNTCAGTAVNFTDHSQVNTGTAIVTWFWTFGDPPSGTNNTSNQQNPLHVYNNAGNYTVVLQVENGSGCPDTVTQVITIQPKPAVDFFYTNICLGTATQFKADTIITNIPAVSKFDWDFGDGSPHNITQQNPLHTYLAAGTYTAVLLITDTAGCTNFKTHVITIAPQPTAMFSAASACLGASTYFTDHSFVTNGELITGWRWDFGVTAATNDTSLLQNPSWVYTTLGTYTVTLTVTSASGCLDTTTMAIQVYGTPTANYTYTAAPCDKGAVYFQDSSFSQQASIVSWNWMFEPNSYSTLQNPVYVYQASDSCYDVRLIVTNNRGCVDTIVKPVCVPAEFLFTFTSSVTCLHDSTLFTPQLLQPLTDSLVFFNWNFGEPSSGIYNSSTLRYPSHLYSTPGIYTVSLEAFDIHNCKDKVYLTVNVLKLPIPSFSYTEGLCDSTVYFNQTSSGNGASISQWIWNYGDGTIDTLYAPVSSGDTAHMYTNAGMYVIGLTVTNANGCSNTVVDSSVLVKPCLNASFEIIDTLICQNNLLSFADSSYSGLPTKEWYWDFGDGTDTTYYVYTNPVNHVFTLPGTYHVRLRISTDIAGKTVSDSTVVTVMVNATPLPEFTVGVVCYLQNAEFTNMTSGNGTLVNSYRWNFGEPASVPNDTSTLRNPVHLYDAPGNYDVKLVTKNTIGCADSIQKQLTVYALPDAAFKYSNSCAGDNTAFTDLSVEAVAPLEHWQWTFSNTTGILGMSDLQDPGFVFTAPGTYLVNLMVSDTNGCIDTITNRNVITWSVPTSIFAYVDDFNDVQGQLQFTNSSLDAKKNYWTFGNGEFSYQTNPVVFYRNDGTYNISLVTYNDKDCTDTLTVEYKFMVKGLYIPNAFSPDNPHKEVQLLKPVGINLKTFYFEVYDRWGTMLWSTDKLDANGRPTEGWDGRINGITLPQGVYVWRASGIFKDGTIWEANSVGNTDHMPNAKTGTATLIR